jgi:hypothetical protein
VLPCYLQETAHPRNIITWKLHAATRLQKPPLKPAFHTRSRPFTAYTQHHLPPPSAYGCWAYGPLRNQTREHANTQPGILMSSGADQCRQRVALVASGSQSVMPRYLTVMGLPASQDKVDGLVSLIVRCSTRVCNLAVEALDGLHGKDNIAEQAQLAFTQLHSHAHADTHTRRITVGLRPWG